MHVALLNKLKRVISIEMHEITLFMTFVMLSYNLYNKYFFFFFSCNQYSKITLVRKTLRIISISLFLLSS